MFEWVWSWCLSAAASAAAQEPRIVGSEEEDAEARLDKYFEWLDVKDGQLEAALLADDAEWASSKAAYESRVAASKAAYEATYAELDALR